MSIFSKIKETFSVLRAVDVQAIAKLSQKIDLGEVMKTVGELDDRQMAGLMRMLKTKARKGQHKLPPIDGDFYDLSLKLTPHQREIQLKVRQFMEKEIKKFSEK